MKQDNSAAATSCTGEKIRLDVNNMFSEAVGKYGIDPQKITELQPKIKKAVQAVAEKRQAGKMDWRDLPYNQADIVAEIKTYVSKVKDQISSLVVLGIGGSALGPMAVQQAINHPYYNELPREKRQGFPKFYVADNVDPERLVSLFEVIDPATSLFNVVSKSGSTSETMSQFMIIKDRLEKELGKEKAKSQIVVTTDAEKGNLIKIAREEGYQTFIIPSGVGGRFSELCPVGLLPAAMCGVQIEPLLAGAADMDTRCQSEDIYQNPALMFAVLNYLALKQGQNVVVMFPYADSLKYIADWFVQLWAESLGKKYNLSEEVVHVGPTPVKALGVTDQHAQVQLFVEGPYDKIIVFIGVDHYRHTLDIPNIYADIPSLGFLGGTTHNTLIQVEQRATEFALTKAGKPNMTLTLPRVNEHTLGQLLYFFEVATAFAGELLEINAFDQPGVEEGKNATYAMFGRPGYAEKKAELDSAAPKKEKYLL